MATVDGITVAKADQIDKKHISTVNVVGGDMKFTRENGNEFSVALPTAGGEPVGVTNLHTPTVTQGIVSGVSTAYFDEWDSAILHGSSLGVTSPAGTACWDYAEAGWYQVQIRIWAGFLVGTDPLPDALLVDFNSWTGVQFSHELALTSGPGSFANRFQHGVQQVITSPIHYCPGSDVASAADGANSIVFKWAGDAVLASGNGAGATNNCARLVVTRLA